MPKTRQVALIVNMNMPYQRKIICGVAAYAQESGRWSLYVEEDPLFKLPNLRTWGGHGIITTFTERRYAEAVRSLNIPVIGVEGGYGWYDPASGIPYFATDNEAVARMAAEHLLGQGYSRLAYVGMPRNRYSLWSVKRSHAFKQRAAEAGTPCSLYVGRHLTTRKWDDLHRGLTHWLRSLAKPVGVMAANDVRARHVLEACRTAGLRVPEEVAVIGVDNDELMCELTDPPLSSVEQGARNIGYRAAELLDRLMSGKKTTQIANYVPPERVVRRRSTDYLAIDDADVAAAVQFIRKHACEHIHMADILDAVGVSRSTLESRFKKVTNKTIRNEIQGTMVARAQQLIAESDLPLKQVAAEAGFTHVQHLTNLFRQRVGQTPSEYRRTARLGLPYPRTASPE